MHKSLFSFAFFAVLFSGAPLAGAQTSEESYKFSTITVRFVDALSQTPISDSEIRTHFDKYDNGDLSPEESYWTNTNGEITLPVQGKVYSFRSDKADNITYVNQRDSVLINVLETPHRTIYLNPIFGIRVTLKTNFNFLLSFFRQFRYGSYLEAPASELNTGSVIEPNCFTRILKKGKTINQHSGIFEIKAYFARDLNSPSKEPYTCYIYAWERIRQIGGITRIDFASLRRKDINTVELPLDMSYDQLIAQYPRIKPPETN